MLKLVQKNIGNSQ